MGLFPGAEPIDYPYYYNRSYVHFLPGGYLNGHTVRVSYLGKTKFTFLDEEKIKEWLVMLHGNKTAPTKILDVGTGNCFSAFAMEDLYPEAEIVAVDLAAPYVRFCRKWAERRNSKVQFYQA